MPSSQLPSPPGEDLVLPTTAFHPSRLKFSRKEDCPKAGMGETVRLASTFGKWRLRAQWFAIPSANQRLTVVPQWPRPGPLLMKQSWWEAVNLRSVTRPRTRGSRLRLPLILRTMSSKGLRRGAEPPLAGPSPWALAAQGTAGAVTSRPRRSVWDPP